MVDARGKDRYNGVTPEPRPGLCSGHVIGSINLPFTNLFDKNSKTFANKDVIEQGRLQQNYNNSNSDLFISVTCCRVF